MTTWQHYDKPVYWDLPDDGATIKCVECKKQFTHDKVMLTQTPNDKRSVLCEECVDPDWLDGATYMGIFTY